MLIRRANINTKGGIYKMGARKVSNRVMGAKELGDVLGINENKIRELARNGKIPGAFRLDGRILFSRERIDRFLEEPEWMPGGAKVEEQT